MSRFDPEDATPVLGAMAAFESRCEEIMALISEKRRLNPDELADVQERYRSLKSDLKEAVKSPYVHEPRRKRELTVCESAFYDPAVRRAHIALRPPTNSNPISSQWFGAVHEAQMEFSYYRHSLTRAMG